jgi:acetyl esterase/lipase
MKTSDRNSQKQHTSFTSPRLAYGPEPLQFGELYIPGTHGLHPIVILIHGGYWRARYGLDLMTRLAEDLASRNIAAWNIEYRRVGDVGGGWPGTFLDVARAADYLHVLASNYSLDLNRVVPIGHSAGGHLALWLAARPRIVKDSAVAGPAMFSEASGDKGVDIPLPLAGVISLAGVVDLHLAWQLHLSNDAVVELLGGSPQEVPERYAAASPAATLPLRVRQVLLHGTEDVNVPLQVSQAYAAAAKAVNDPVTLVELPGVEHFAVIDPSSDAWDRAIEELQKILRRS